MLKSNNVRLNPPNYVVFSKFIYFTEIYTFSFIYIVYTQFIYSLSALYPSENREVFNMKEADFEEEMIDMIDIEEDESFVNEEELLEEDEIDAITEAFLRGYKAA